MAVRDRPPELELIAELSSCVAQRLTDEPPEAYEPFARQYYQWVPEQDLRDRSPLDLCGAIVAHWRLASQRPPGEPKVRVYNPELERDGWHSPFTVVEIVSDDMPFIVDSITMELSRQDYGIELLVHPVMRAVRDSEGRLGRVLESDEEGKAVAESVIHVEVTQEADPDRLSVLQAGVELVLEEVRAAVEDWEPMRLRALTLAQELAEGPHGDRHETQEAETFLRWLVDDHFTFLGYREYELDPEGELTAVAGSGLGVLRGASAHPTKRLSERAVELASARHPLVLTKANSRATVHRPAYLDYVGVKRFGPDGRTIGERRLLGLYTTTTYNTDPQDIPLLREKVEQVLGRAGFPSRSHDAKGLLDILESLPRDLLFQIAGDDLFDLAIGILGLGERQRVRLFVTRDQLDRFMACTLCLPRDRFNTENRQRAGAILLREFGGAHVDWRLQRSESVVVRVDYVIHCPDGVKASYDVAAIEAQIAEATRNWSDDLRAALVAARGEQKGHELHERYRTAFPPGYRAYWSASGAVADIGRIGEVIRTRRAGLTIYRSFEDGQEALRAKLVSPTPVLLSDVLPTFEHMGTKVLDERPYEIAPRGRAPVWIYDFGLDSSSEALQGSEERFAQAFLAVWEGELEDDRLGGLVLAAGLTGREVTIIRSISRYLRQAPVAFSDRYMERTLLGNPEVVKLLVALFKARFDPDARDEQRAEQLAGELREAIDVVRSLDEDRILRSFLAVMEAMLRTNFYRRDDFGRPTGWLSFKLDSPSLLLLPQPRPRFEIFVYSPRVEGVHLRGGKVARGGLRWSDRREDFRTEVLGLMKAQMVKNALIVPVGSKGGFVVKRPPRDGSREEQLSEGVACYRVFLRGLLDLTDNYVDGEAVSPPCVVSYDEPDPYLVVAADKGTASFSDTANEVAAEYGFWLGDAFASGGTHGYDHKAMGITARGAWESVKRHFRELGTDIQREDCTVVGIGDMSGDVFGNGMLCSEHLKLVAAFNHQHVFLDPDPEPATSYAERHRLFELERSSWSDYDTKLISEGGGVFDRSAKAIPLSEPVRQLLGIDDEKLSPAELIRALLKCPVDLLFNGGIGTYVKAGGEGQADAGDRANDPVRVDGADLRCRVVGEGGNLGFTQAGRVEYALRGGPSDDGGRINTDSIDNVAGVNCSDHEVNIKILLDDAVAGGDLDEDQRNDLLSEMTDSVAGSVLYACYSQTQALSLAERQAGAMVDVHRRLIRHLEQRAGLHRELERLPDDETLIAGRPQRRGLVAPELAVVMAYAKIELFEQLLASDLPEDPSLFHDLERYFPAPLPERFGGRMHEHRLRREIICTVVANQLVDRGGTTFAFRLGEETDATPAHLARAFAAAREIFGMRRFWTEVEGMDGHLEANVQLEVLLEGRKLVERATRWLVRGYPRSLEIKEVVAKFAAGAQLLAAALPAALEGQERERFIRRIEELREQGLPAELARQVASMPSLLSLFDIVEESEATGRSQPVVTATYFGLGSLLRLDWLRDRILELPRGDRWQALARTALRDDLYRLHRAVIREALVTSKTGRSDQVRTWQERHAAGLQRALRVIEEVEASGQYDSVTLPVVLRELNSLLDGP
jgi:glutamate dehydrogenase